MLGHFLFSIFVEHSCDKCITFFKKKAGYSTTQIAISAGNNYFFHVVKLIQFGYGDNELHNKRISEKANDSTLSFRIPAESGMRNLPKAYINLSNSYGQE